MTYAEKVWREMWIHDNPEAQGRGNWAIPGPVSIISAALKKQREKAWADAWAEVSPFLIGMGKKQVDGIFAALRKAILGAEVEK